MLSAVSEEWACQPFNSRRSRSRFSRALAALSSSILKEAETGFSISEPEEVPLPKFDIGTPSHPHLTIATAGLPYKSLTPD
ncbi:MAG: hypothetical protein F7C81_03410 [Desulfurococcales archaeon]|nr:hypothetical protein [Desulfurococcales archaeon]